MREISFVKNLKFNFNGSVTKRALVLGDADNDQHNELVCANLQGDLGVFKGDNPNKYAYAEKLGMITACIVGDIINGGKNYVSAINMEGWLFIFDLTQSINSNDSCDNQEGPIKMSVFYDQRMPANCKELLIADLDGDGQNEVIIGLTDRVLRTYKWIKIGPNRGKFVGLYKWEFADQIGAVSLNPSQHENCQDIIVAQPGGTYAKLECVDKKNSTPQTTSTTDNELKPDYSQVTDPQNQSNTSHDDDNVRTEYISKLTPEYHQLALTQMRNHHISTEVLGGIRLSKNSDCYSLIVIATLDGTLMLVNKDETLWSLQVDHQLFALSLLEVKNQSKYSISQSESTCTIVPNNVDLSRSDKTSATSQYFVVCAWNGKTYIIDEDRNYLRFKFNEAVSAFTAGNYHFAGQDFPSLVYASFNNQIILYYDVILDNIRPMYLLNELNINQEHSELLDRLKLLADKLGYPQESRNELLRDLLYSVTDEELEL